MASPLEAACISLISSLTSSEALNFDNDAVAFYVVVVVVVVFTCVLFKLIVLIMMLLLSMLLLLFKLVFC